MGEHFNKKCSIETNEQLGRYVRAKDDIATGECILLEQPTLIMASDNEKRCNNCFQLAQTYCSSCKITVLCQNCRTHNHYDCQKLSAMTELDCVQLRHFSESYGIIKCLLLQENPETRQYFDLMLQAECHLDERRGTGIWMHYQKNVVEPILKSHIAEYLTHGSQLNADFLQRLCALIDVNGFEIRAPDCGSMKGVFINGALLSHDCTSNTQISIDDKYCMKIYANRDIATGETVTNCYTNVLLGTDDRQRILKMGKYFNCTCKRCKDSTEFGSHMSSLLCPACHTGFMIKDQLKDTWQCIDCQHKRSSEEIESILLKFQEDILTSPSDLQQLEIILQKLSKVLHPHHYMIIDVKQNIASLLRMILNNNYLSPGRKVYERKIELCKDIMEVLNIIIPGATISRLKAITLYELASTTAEYNRMRYKENELDKPDLKELLHENEQMLRQSIRMLLYEPKDTPEGKLVQTMLQELKYLQEDMKMLL